MWTAHTTNTQGHTNANTAIRKCVHPLPPPISHSHGNTHSHSLLPAVLVTLTRGVTLTLSTQVTTIATAYTGSSFQWFPLGLSLAPSSAYSIRLVSANPSSPSLSGSFSIVGLCGCGFGCGCESCCFLGQEVKSHHPHTTCCLFLCSPPSWNAAAILSLSRSNPSVVVFNGYTDTLEASVSNADYISNSVAEYEVQVYRGVDFVRSISLVGTHMHTFPVSQLPPYLPCNLSYDSIFPRLVGSSCCWVFVEESIVSHRRPGHSIFFALGVKRVRQHLCPRTNCSVPNCKLSACAYCCALFMSGFIFRRLGWGFLVATHNSS